MKIFGRYDYAQDFSYDETKVDFNVDAPNGVVMEGYLFKRASNAFKTWNRRWFSIQNSQLDSLTVVVEDLRLCSVKPCEDIERRFCFEVAVQASIASAYRESPDNYSIERLDRTASPSTSSIDSASEPRERSVRGESHLQRVQNIPGNELCCDCGQSLGVHCSKVRSLTLDSWEPELLKLMCELGNGIINQIYEGTCEELGLKKPGPSSSRQEKEAWIKAKYVEKRFLKKMAGGEALVNGERKSSRWSVKKCQRHNSSTRAPKSRRKYRHEAGSASPGNLSTGLSSDSGLGGSTDGSTDILVFGPVVDSVTEEETSDPEDPRELHPGALLYKASRARNLPIMAEALAHGADVNAVSEEDESKSPLIQAVIGNGADVNQRDVRGRGPLHHATQVCLFLKRGATQNDGDEDGHDPLSIAVQAANADIVTLLRLARMNEEMRESEGPFGQPGDTTYLDIFREFSHMASHDPEKLKRRSSTISMHRPREEPEGNRRKPGREKYPHHVPHPVKQGLKRPMTLRGGL
ncbi:hypothetical protein JZ751_023952 [Albula glossodonta]|uniref:Arf-GAP with coiled-coil, ANK repeat and PH domain-containing protein n=1 Tax=Albula glossodonta TaxID=121402 RepID=A0A8T2NFV9_9TELE|nr:hypothetical protein JZ751_023952 [Albula glossodonta]